jgi:hypothetical protein
VRQCNSCQFENADDARVCARCGAVLARGDSESAAQASDQSEPTLPAWMQSMQHGGEHQLVAGTANGVAAGAVATVASLPVQVRRSRGPLLTVDIGSGAAPASAEGAAPGSAVIAQSANSDMASGRAGSSRLRLILLFVIIIAALAYLILRFGI